MKKNKHEKTEVPLHGWDWTEISRILGVDIKLDEKYVLSNTRKKIKKIQHELVIHNKVDEEDELKINQIKYFLELLCKNNSTYITPLFKGLKEIEDHCEFLKFVDILLPHLWD